MAVVSSQWSVVSSRIGYMMRVYQTTDSGPLTTDMQKTTYPVVSDPAFPEVYSTSIR